MILCGLAFVATETRATGHYVPGVFNIRDFVVPDPGFYGALYNYFYTTNRINDSNGNQINSVNIGPRKDLKVNVDVSLDLYAVAPAFLSGCPTLRFWVRNTLPLSHPVSPIPA